MVRELVDLKVILAKLAFDAAALKWLGALCMAIVSYFLPAQAQRDAMVGAIWLILTDMVTGMIAARSTGKAITSAKLSRTIVKVIAYGAVISVASVVTRHIPGAAEFQGASITGVLTLMILTEAVSILENARAMGVTLPDTLERWLKDRVDGHEENK